LMVKEEVIGILAFHQLSAAHRCVPEEIDFVGNVASAVSLAVENARLYEEQRSIAGTLQEAFLTAPEKIEGLDFGHLYHAATEVAKVGGDFFDLFELDERKVGILIGDVSGKGLEAAKMTAMIKNTIAAHAHEEDSPAETLKKANRLACRAFPPSSFATVFLGILDKMTGTLRYCNAGHPPPIVRRAAARSSFLGTGNGPVGIWEEFDYDDRETVLQSGDVFFAYTDGLFEARRDTKFYGEKRLRKAVNDSTLSVSRLPQAVFDQVVGFANGHLSDDIAILSVSLKKKSA
jgi:sigma-B regulation protein RsbU (phosphoserine phosphatase)